MANACPVLCCKAHMCDYADGFGSSALENMVCGVLQLGPGGW
jgi:hypothetical protein